MKRYRDSHQAGAHSFALGGIRLDFDGDGLLSPTAEQLAAITATEARRDRFVEVDEPQPEALAPIAEPEALAAPIEVPAEVEGNPTSSRRRRRDQGAE